MKIHTFEQGSPEWFMGRLGIPTASRFNELLTPKTRKPAASRERYMAELLAEWVLNQPIDWGSNSIVERGTDLEDEARRYYSMLQDVDVQRVGFVTRDDGLAGGSPDGLVGSDGVLEIKNYMAVHHMQALLGTNKPDEHLGQIQGYLYLTDRAWCDLIFYNPELPKRIIRVDRDQGYLDAFLPVLEDFIGGLEAHKVEYASERILRPWMEELS